MWKGKKKGGELGKAVLIADQLELKVNIIFALLILVPLQKKNIKLHSLSRGLRNRDGFFSWKSLHLLSPSPTKKTNDKPLFRALAWNKGEQTSVVTVTDILGDPWQVI